MTWVKSTAGVISWPDGFDDEPDDADLEPARMDVWHREDRDARIRSLYREGFTPAEIAARVDTTATTVSNVVRVAGLPSQRARRRQLVGSP